VSYENSFWAANGKLSGVHLTHQALSRIEEEDAFANNYRCRRTGRQRVWIGCARAQEDDLSLSRLGTNIWMYQESQREQQADRYWKD
jgi:hypothetical protein